MTSPEADRVKAYMETVGRLEPDITPIDHDAAMASIAISLKRLADVLDEFGLLAEAFLRQTAADAGQDYETIKEQLRSGVLPKPKGP